MRRRSDAVLEQITERHRAAAAGLFSRDAAPHAQRRRVRDSLDDLPVLLAAYREAVVLNARYREALQWCLDEGGWQLTYYENNGPPPAGVFSPPHYTKPRLLDEAETVAALGLPSEPEPQRETVG